jgi:hypothetical protein
VSVTFSLAIDTGVYFHIFEDMITIHLGNGATAGYLH